MYLKSNVVCDSLRVCKVSMLLKWNILLFTQSAHGEQLLWAETRQHSDVPAADIFLSEVIADVRYQTDALQVQSTLENPKYLK